MPVSGQELKIHTIMLVEDHPLVRQAIRQLIEGEPELQVPWVAASAESALEQLESARPDLVITDLSLPGMNGLKLIEHLKVSHSDVNCLVLTGHVDAFYKKAALAAGAIGFVTKDDADEVLEAVKKALNLIA